MYYNKFSLLIGLMVSLSGNLASQQLMLTPDETTGGRGGVVYHVFRSDDPEVVTFGTLRYAVEQQGARTIVFDTQDPIVLSRDLILHNPDITIAGQTAKSGYVGIVGYNLIADCTNVILSGLFYTSTGVNISQSLTMSDILAIDSNMNGIPDCEEIQLFGKLVNGNGHLFDSVKTNLEWYLDSLTRENCFEDETRIHTVMLTDSSVNFGYDSFEINKSIIGLPQGKYQIREKTIIVK